MERRPCFSSRSFLGFDGGYQESGIILFGAPFDGTVTFRPGSRFAPSAMRSDSDGLETYSPYQDKDLSEFILHDAGDLELPPGRTEKALSLIGEFAEQVYSDGKLPVMMGGEHLVSLPVVVAALKHFPDLCMLHFDAHTDLREEYLGEKLSHACVLRRIWEHLGDGRIWQFGIRSGLREEFEWAKADHTALHPFDLGGVEKALRSIGGRPVYLTVDLDVLDPSCFPGTGTPEPGGVTFMELLQALLNLKGIPLVGVDIVELSPHYDVSGASTAAACKVLRESVLLLASAPPPSVSK